MNNLLLSDYIISSMLFILSILACILLIDVKSHIHSTKHSNKIKTINTDDSKTIQNINDKN
jgi:hypothetical protein